VQIVTADRRTLWAGGYIQLMQTAAKGDVGHFPPVIPIDTKNDDTDTFLSNNSVRELIWNSFATSVDL